MYVVNESTKGIFKMVRQESLNICNIFNIVIFIKVQKHYLYFYIPQPRKMAKKMTLISQTDAHISRSVFLDINLVHYRFRH